MLRIGASNAVAPSSDDLQKSLLLFLYRTVQDGTTTLGVG